MDDRSERSIPRRVPLYLLLGCVAVIAVGTIVATHWLPYGIPDQWEWQAQLLGQLPLTVEAAAVFVATLLVAAAVGALALLRPRLTRAHIAISLLALVIASLSLCLALVGMEPPRSDAMRTIWGGDPWRRSSRERVAINVGDIMFSDVAFGYYREAAGISDVGAFLRGYEERIRSPETPQRVQTHPPGAVLAIWALRRVAFAIGSRDALARTIGPERWATTVDFLKGSPHAAGPSEDECAAAVLVALALILRGALLPVPTFLLARQFGNRRRALVAASMAAFLPGALLFVPGIDQTVALLGTFALWLFCMGLRRGNVWMMAGAGAAFSLDSLISIGAASLAVMAGLVAVAPVAISWRHAERRPRAIRRAAIAVGSMLAGVLLPLVLLRLVYGYNALTVALTAAGQQRAIVVDQWHRSYGAWLVLNLVDFAVFLGPGAAVCLVAWLAIRLRRWRAGGPLLRADLLLIAFVVTLALVDLSGSARAEVGRIWMLFMPVACVLAARRATHHPPAQACMFSLAVVMLQILTTVVLQQHLDVMTPH